MRGSKYRVRDPHRLMTVTCMIFYGGLGLLALAWAFLELVPILEKTVLPLALLACALTAIFIASGLSVLVRCPCCGAWLCRGMRLPGRLPRHCPKCGKPL